MSGPAPAHQQTEAVEEPPPFFGTWPRVYLGVIGWLAVLIVVFYVFAREFTP
jgi:hypothetical protein